MKLLQEIENSYEIESILEKEIKEKVFGEDNLEKYFEFIQGNYQHANYNKDPFSYNYKQ